MRRNLLPCLLAIARRDWFDELFILAIFLFALYVVARLADRWGLGRRRTSQWRFIGGDGPDRRFEPSPQPTRDDADNPFDILQIEPTDDLNRINAAYIRLATKTHPDLNSGDKAATKKFQRVQQAFSRVGDVESLRLYLMQHPLKRDAGEAPREAHPAVVDLDLFKRDWPAYRVVWQQKKAAAERDMKYLQGPSMAPADSVRRLLTGLADRFRPARPPKMIVESVCFLSEGENRPRNLPYLQVFGKLLRVATQDELHAVVTFLLTTNEVYFMDHFHTSQTVSFRDIGRRPGQNAALSPGGSYAEFVTNLAKLGLYQGPDVRKIR